MAPRLRSTLIGAAIALVTLLGGTTSAQAPPSWSFEPTNPQSGPGRNWFILEVQPGQVIRDSVTLVNPLDRPLSFQIYAADAYNTPEGGAFAIRDPDAAKEGVSRWITLATDAYTVQPEEQVVIPFEIRVPTNAEPGDHVGAVAAMNVNPESSTTSGGVAVDIKRVIGTRVYARVAGPLVPSIRVDAVKVKTSAPLVPLLGDGRGSVTYTVTNTGNVRLSPAASVRVSSPFGELFEQTGIELQELLPGSSQTMTQPFEKLPVVGPVTATVDVVAMNADASSAATGWVIPWLVVGLLVLGIAIVMWIRRRRPSSDDRPRARHTRSRELVGSGRRR